MTIKPLDLIVVLLASVLSFVVLGVGIRSLVFGDLLTETQTEIVGGILLGMLNIVSMYVGAKIQQARDSQKDAEK